MIDMIILLDVLIKLTIIWFWLLIMLGISKGAFRSLSRKEKTIKERLRERAEYDD